MPGRYGTLDYPLLTKAGFGLGAALFVVGAVGQYAGHAMYGTLPAWEATLLLDFEFLGVAAMLLSPFVFAVLLPLTE